MSVRINGKTVAGGFTSTPATKENRGIVRIATDEEAKSGSLEDVAITPKQLRTYGGGGGIGFEILDIGIAPFGIDETQNKRRYLNGQIIVQSQFIAATKKLKRLIGWNEETKTASLLSNIICTEEEWQATVTMSTYGQCGKFVIDDEAGTIRLPKITSFIQGLTDLASLGELVEGSLPAITTKTTTTTSAKVTVPNTGWTVSGSGTLGTVTKGTLVAGSGNAEKSEGLESMNRTTASRAATVTQGATSTSTSTYNDNKVQPEAIRYPYFIQVATGVEESVDVTREIELNNPFFFGYYQYFEIAPNNTSWLKSEGQWNNKEVYPDYYDWVLTNANSGVANFKLSTDTYDDYAWVVNTADETFRLPIKTKNAPFTVSGAKTTLSMGAVSIKGNGKTLGLTDGTLTGGMATNNNYAAYGLFQKGAYNVNVGTAVTPGSTNNWENNNKSIGVTTDPTKSGLTGSVSGTATTTVSTSENTNVSLYFYVGETTQNANLVNVGRIEESLAKKLDISTVRYDSSTSTLYIGM